MATVKFEGFDAYEKMLAKLGDSTDSVLKQMVSAGLRILYAKIKSANATFARYVKMKAARKNQYGWFAQVQFKGKTESGAPAALAVNVYEHGRSGNNAQPARPWLDAACAAAEPECIAEMQRIYDEEAQKLAGS
ncbi:MAG: hypothetical protein VB061_08355 [Christensenella sp.]|nr:hypothetical protein [Christensenella sp.]